MKYTTKQIGDAGEKYAAKYLKKHRYKILDKNYRRSFGEIDIVARKKNLVVFVEVKTRKHTTLFEPSLSVDRKKQSKIKKTALAYLYEHKMEIYCRFDICEIYIDCDNLKPVNINYIEDAF